MSFRKQNLPVGRGGSGSELVGGIAKWGNCPYPLKVPKGPGPVPRAPRFWTVVVTLLFGARRYFLFVFLAGLVLLVGGGRRTRPPYNSGPLRSRGGLPFAPRTYAICRASAPVTIDGRLTEADWEAAPWTTDFVDIRGPDAPTPRHRTRAKMLWDEEGLYVAARLKEAVFTPTLRTTQSGYEFTAPGSQGARVHLRSDGKTWTTTE